MATKCKVSIVQVDSWRLVVLPKAISARLASRGMVLVKGLINSHAFTAVLEPDGRGSHWLRIDDAMQASIEADAGDAVTLEIEPSDDWPEPTLPHDIATALKKADAEAQALWDDITPMARWDWIRWIRATSNPETRKIRIQKTFSKLKDGIRRPCCFNRAMCTEPSICKNGVLVI